MKKIASGAAGFCLAFGLAAHPALAKGPPAKPADKCTLSIKAEFEKEGRGSTTFTLSPVHKGALYNWALDNGNVAIGQGTAAIVIDNPPAGQAVTATVEAIDRPSCPDKSNTATIRVKIPKSGGTLKVEPSKTASPKAAAKPAAKAQRALATRRLPETDAEKKFFEAIKANQTQLAVNTSIAPPGGKPLAVAELADKDGMTALHWAVANKNKAGMRWLLDKHAEVDLADEKGRTPLRIALDNKDAGAIRMLVNTGADIDLAWPGHAEDLKGINQTEDLVNFLLKNASPS